jgi:hypothetical protein
MFLKDLILIAVTLATMAVSSGRLPAILHQVRVMQLEVLKESQASRWGRPMLVQQ